MLLQAVVFCKSGSFPSTSAVRTMVPWEEEGRQPPAPSTDPGCPGKGAGLCSVGSAACPLVTGPVSKHHEARSASRKRCWSRVSPKPPPPDLGRGTAHGTTDDGAITRG